MTQSQMTIRWRNKPLDRLSPDELRSALADALQQVVTRQGTTTPLQSFYATFVCGMLAGGSFCFGALAILHGIG